jgi:steroid delta-isomerase-like uncharacterized protein
MSAVQTSTHVQRYFDAWNAHDPDAIVAAFVEGGTYTDPNVGSPPLTGETLVAYAQGLFDSFPDLTFENVQHDVRPGGATCARWLMRGTNSGGMRWPPSGQAIALPGVDVITTTDDGVSSVEGYFDRQTMFEQLGLQVLVQPRSAGPFRFGYGLKTETETADPPVPGAITLTWIATRSEAEADEVRALTRPLAAGLRELPGFLSWMGVGIGDRLYTITAWESEEAARQVMEQPIHKQAVKRFFSEDFGAAVHTAVWTAGRVNALWVRCPQCAIVIDAGTHDSCSCGHRFTSRPLFW